MRAPHGHNGEDDSEHSGIQPNTVECVSLECWLGYMNTYSASRKTSQTRKPQMTMVE